MATSFTHAKPSEQRSSVLPPWLWFWLAIYIIGVSSVFDRVKVNLLILFTGNDGINSSIRYSAFERVPGVVEILLDFALFTGVLTVFLPWIRTVFLQRKYGLTEPQFLPPGTPQQTLQTLSGVSGFVREHAPGLILTYNAGGKILSDKAFVYPIGYRKAGLALSGRLLALWNRDQQAAEAILLHEIEHFRHGDMLVIGDNYQALVSADGGLRYYSSGYISPDRTYNVLSGGNGYSGRSTNDYLFSCPASFYHGYTFYCPDPFPIVFLGGVTLHHSSYGDLVYGDQC